MVNKLLTIITVSLNAESVVRDTLYDLISQKEDWIECIVIDGKSEDATLKIINEYREAIDIVVSEKDSGIYDAMNKGISIANGKWIAFLNCGDTYCSGILHQLKEIFLKEDADIIYGTNNIINEQGTILKHNETTELKSVFWRMPFCHQAVFAKRELFEAIGLFDTRYKICADHDWLVKAYLKGSKFKKYNICVVNYLDGGVSSSNPLKTAYENQLIFDSIKDELRGEIDEHFVERKLYDQRLYANLMQMIQSSHPLLNDLFGEFGKMQIIIWGAGTWGKRLASYFLAKDYKLVSFIDNNPCKIGDEIYGLRVGTIEILNGFSGVVIMSAESIDEEVLNEEKKHISNLGIETNRVKFVALRTIAERAFKDVSNSEI